MPPPLQAARPGQVFWEQSYLSCHSRDHDGGHLVGDDGLGLTAVQACGLEGVDAE